MIRAIEWPYAFELLQILSFVIRAPAGLNAMPLSCERQLKRRVSRRQRRKIPREMDKYHYTVHRSEWCV